ncbi:MAG TPA: acyl-ACP--UDP-N-acetylglucosamine O-acyltransferase [Polyangiaceae bacterium]|nr:acyl-ACP--UDP-N-acetylglucosamine O-acyltransferase [Polyangiaceae bacterium]
MSSDRSLPFADESTAYDPSLLRRMLGGAAAPPAPAGEAEPVDEAELFDEGEGPATEREAATERGAATAVHASAIVAPEARLDPGVEVGPFVVVGAQVEVGPGCKLLASCVLEGPLVLGAGNRVHPFAVLGAPPQDRSHEGEPTRLVVGEGNEFREHVTVHRGTAKDRGLTRIGSGGLFMAGSHVAHDCAIGDHVTLANGTLLGGHVVLEDHVVTGGRAAVAPKVRVGAGAFLAAGAMVERDVPPFVIAAGDRARVRALNLVGLERMGVPASSRGALERAFRHLYHSGRPLAAARASLDPALAEDPYVARLLAFLAARG